MFSIDDIIPCFKALSNTETIQLTYDQINACDEPAVSACHAPFIKKYHHFTYPRAAVVHCKYMKGKGEYQEETMKQQKDDGMILLFIFIIITTYYHLLSLILRFVAVF